ncbi:MAG: hypothetical protein IRZ13_14125 [Acetobacteraceae bacterium]|nr:hypothetical protein [Acetobacteraceae bacterium]
MTWSFALSAGMAAASLGVAALQAGAQYEQQRAQAALGRQMAGLRREQLAIERDTLAVQARAQEVERQRRAGLTESTARATAAAFGLDPWQSGSIATLRGENERQVLGDISAIRLLGAAKQRQLLISDRLAELEAESYAAMARTAWIRPTATLLGAGLSVYQTWPIMGAEGGGTPDNLRSLYAGLTDEQVALVEPRTGRARGPV